MSTPITPSRRSSSLVRGKRARVGRRAKAAGREVAALDDEQEIAQRSFVRGDGMQVRRQLARRHAPRILRAGSSVEPQPHLVEMQKHPSLALGVALARCEDAADIVVADDAAFDVRRRREIMRCEAAAGHGHMHAVQHDPGHALGLGDSGPRRLLGFVEIGDDPAFDPARFLMSYPDDAQARTARPASGSRGDGSIAAIRHTILLVPISRTPMMCFGVLPIQPFCRIARSPRCAS